MDTLLTQTYQINIHILTYTNCEIVFIIPISIIAASDRQVLRVGVETLVTHVRTAGTMPQRTRWVHIAVGHSIGACYHCKNTNTHFKVV